MNRVFHAPPLRIRSTRLFRRYDARRGGGGEAAVSHAAAERAQRRLSVAPRRARHAGGGPRRAGVLRRPRAVRVQLSWVPALHRRALTCRARSRHDYEGYVCTLALPASVRPAALALRAFNAETAAVLDSAKEVPLALMRLRWWRDAVGAALARAPPAHPVARALAATLPADPAAAAVVAAQLERLVLCRESDAGLAGLPPSLEALQVYAEGTAGSLLRALLAATGDRSRAGEVAAGAAGAAAGLAALLAGARPHLARGRVYLPADALRREGVTPEALRFEGGGPGARRVVQEVADAARARLAVARAARDALEPMARRVMLPAVPTALFLDALAREGHDAFADALARKGGVVSPTRLHLAVGWAALRGRY